ncbi:MAG: hypothetical protein ACRBN8_16560 [Nannocystales bacterium]
MAPTSDGQAGSTSPELELDNPVVDVLQPEDPELPSPVVPSTSPEDPPALAPPRVVDPVPLLAEFDDDPEPASATP